MSKSSEEVLLIVKNVKNKKTDGTLYMMGERMAWMLESKNVFNISYMYADIKTQKISPETKEKVQLQVILNDGSANTFLFNNPKGRQVQLQDRESVKELLQQLLPRFKRKISSELEEKNRILQQDPESYQLYKDLVVSGVISPEEFWASRSHLLSTSSSSSSSKSSAGQNVGVSPAFLADIKPQTDGANGLKYNLTADIIQSIFKTYPMVKKKHAEAVPHSVSESEFWTRFFQSHYFHRDRQALASKDIFTECAKNDEEVMKEEISKNVNDPLVDLTQIKDQEVDEEYRGIVDDTRASNNTANQSMIRRFNQHSTMVLRACSNTTPSSSTPDPITAESPAPSNGRKTKLPGSLNGVQPFLNGASTSSGYTQEPHIKKRKIKEKLEYEDLDNKDAAEGVTLRLTHMDRYLHGPTPATSSFSHDNRDVMMDVTTEDSINAVAYEVSSWGHSRHRFLGGTQALSVLGELSPGGALMSGTTLQKLHQQVAPATRDEIKQNYNAMCELLRHFWACFPVSSKALEDKVLKMRMTLERFEMSKLVPLKEKLTQYHYAMNLTGHLEEMLRAAYNKFDLWQAKRSARR
ncbi:general transcription factor IIH subunit 1-like [Physella acuta]|uniref:general transcription factor IIH subunit 1-like n=1 Tax=Physella acuta TaxID=109671 RepID=UPI0027DCDBCE|nr:general transcription factor IIH subunit 1-like [Physella acuta]XP_059154426.1 general transcription factor IIH subunit 1-like [Physella acuta]XP_059154427.1 general transcription factor IIH subunit 1-like [Physella acuta]